MPTDDDAPLGARLVRKGREKLKQRRQSAAAKKRNKARQQRRAEQMESQGSVSAELKAAASEVKDDPAVEKASKLGSLVSSGASGGKSAFEKFQDRDSEPFAAFEDGGGASDPLDAFESGGSRSDPLDAFEDGDSGGVLDQFE